jgi:hypothetical protein
LQSAQWTAIETDTVSVPQVPGITDAGAVTDSAVQSVNLRVNGFQNKAIGRIMIAKVYQDQDLYLYGPAPGAVKGIGQYGSRVLHKEAFNMRVNGRNILAGAGIDTPASQTMLLSDTFGELSQTMLLSDTFGELNMCPGQNQESMGLDTKYDLTDATLTPVGRPPRNFVGVNRTQPRILTDGGDLAPDGLTWTTPPTAEQGFWLANAGFIGIGIHDRCSDMSVQLTRTGTPSTPRTPATLSTDCQFICRNF